MRILKIILANLIAWTPVHATLNDVDKTQIWNKNLLVNGGFENGKAKWTPNDSADLTTTTTSPMIGLVHGLWDADASTDTLTTTAVAIPAGMFGRNGAASCLFTVASGTATNEIQVYDGSNVLVEATITSSTIPTRTAVNFPFPSSGSLSIRIYANADEPSVSIDDCYLGPAEGYNLDNISQTQFIASGYYATTANCLWSRTSSTQGAFTADTDCPAPTVEFNPGPGTLSTTDADLPQFTMTNLPPGRYRVEMHLCAFASGANNVISFSIFDGTTSSGRSVSGDVAGTVTNATLEGIFNYTTTQSSVTFSIYGSTPTNTANIEQRADLCRTTFSLYRFPLTSEQAYRPDANAQSWSGYHDNTCSFARTNTAYGAFTADATCGFAETNNQNFGTVASYVVTNNMPGITWTPQRAGRYFVCATTKLLLSGVSQGLRLYNITSSLQLSEAFTNNTTATNHTTMTLCGIYVATSTASQTVVIEGKSSSGAITLSTLTSNDSLINWQIFSIDQSLPAPQLTGSMVSNSAGVLKTIAATLNCDAGSAITSQTGTTSNGIATIGNVASRICSGTFATGTFSTTPYCIAGDATTGATNNNIVDMNATSSTAFQTSCDGHDAADCSAYDINIICIGAP